MFKSEEHYLEGLLEDCTIVSIPETASNQSAAQIKDKLEKELGHLVLVVTHNVQFLKAEPLKPGERAKVIKRVQDIQEERSRILGADGRPAR